MPDTPGGQMSCYAPDPRHTFLLSGETDIHCVICHESKLTLPTNSDPVTDSDPSLLPCGHVFGTLCLKLWLQNRKSCPVCRLDLQYELCSHPLQPRRLTRGNILWTPPTIPAGGRIGDQCGQCDLEIDQNVAAVLCIPRLKHLHECKLKYQQTGLEHDRQELMEAQKEFDFIMGLTHFPKETKW